FALSEEMRRYADRELMDTLRRPDPRRALIDALYRRSQLGLSYDASMTRNAAEAFQARAGNCLSLVIMTAAFAKHMGLPVSYRNVLVDAMYTRQGDLTMANGHVNLILDEVSARPRREPPTPGPLQVDFLPPEDMRGARSVALQERTILAMFMNNRAAEALNAGRLDDSYAWAREAVRQDPGFSAAINTLGVVYLRAGHPQQAEAALRAVLARNPSDVAALSNLLRLVQDDGREAEARGLGERLARLQPHPPFHFFDLGRAAMAAGDYAGAQKLFDRELTRQPLQHEVRFWAAQAAWHLGDAATAADHLRQAMDNSPDPRSQAVYATKLDHLLDQFRASRLQ
ncbi:MAG TPA: tetratricopeptide repeat protein, partial [Rubrivivax sp.]|nr:tetratricopeptide repeat protein [Rubrivivax sp.]